MPKLNVVIIGAGLGGLCLAQSLRRAGLNVAIYERDATPWDRPQGYRLHIDSDGINALREALTPALYVQFDATSMRPRPFTTLIDTAFSEIKRVPSGDLSSARRDGAPAHVNVNRATLRQILLSGLGDICHFGATLTGYTEVRDGVVANFADGTTVTADILVGADGIRSAVRRQRAPQAQIVDTGVCAIYGRLPIERAQACLPRQVLEDVFTVASDPRKVFLGLGPVIFPTRPEMASAALFKHDDYVVSIVGGRREHFGGAELRRADGVELQNICGEMLKDWPAATATIPTQGDPTSFFFVEMNTSVPCAFGRVGRVTLLGDAAHAMTPTLGKGANVAMRDGALLGRLLILAERRELSVDEALMTYETEMTRYGFDIVRKSAAMGERLIGQNPLPDSGA